MRNIVTATGLSQLNKQISNHPDFVKVLNIDYGTQEELLRSLQEKHHEKIDAILMIDKLTGPFSKWELVEMVRDVYDGEIIIIIEETTNEYLRFLREKKIINYFSLSESPEKLLDVVIYDGEEKVLESSKIHEAVLVDEKSEKQYIKKKVVAFIGPGGSGKTTIVKNITELIDTSVYSVCVVDVNFEKPDVTNVFAIKDDMGFERFLKMELSSNEVLESVIVGKRGISYFGGLMDLMKTVKAESLVKYIIKTLKRHYDLVLIDTGSIGSIPTHEAILEADEHVVIMSASERDIKFTRKYLELYHGIEKPLKPIGILNKFVEMEYEKADIEEMLGFKIVSTIEQSNKIYKNIETGKSFEKKEAAAVFKLKEELFPTFENKSKRSTLKLPFFNKKAGK